MTAARNLQWQIRPKRLGARLANGDLRGLDWDLQLPYQIRRLVEAGQVGKARQVLDELDDNARARPAIARWIRALRRSRVRRLPASGGYGFAASRAWLAAHAAEHAGRWVALRGGELLGSNADYGRLRAALDPQALADTVFVRIPEQ